MKYLDIDWFAFLDALELYRALPRDARRFFVEEVKPSQPVPKGAIAPWGDPLVASGLMMASQTGVNFSVAPEYREFSRTIRFMGRGKVLESPSRSTFQTYVGDNLGPAEIEALSGSNRFWRLDHYAWERVFLRVCSSGWPKQFLAARNSDWEAKYRDSTVPSLFDSTPVFQAAQHLVRVVANEGEPVPFTKLREIGGSFPPEVFSAAIRTVLRYLLLFTSLRSSDFEPVIGLWPGIAERALGKSPAPPSPVQVVDAFHSPFLMEDMVVILSSCAVEPIRLRSGDMRIFESARQSLAQALGTLPGWVESLHFGADTRITMAIDFLRHCGHINQTGRPGADFRLEATESGSRWLSMTSKQRLRQLLDSLLKAPKKVVGIYGHQYLTLVPFSSSMSTRGERETLSSAIIAAYATLKPDVFIRVADHLTYQARTRNPLEKISGEDRYFVLEGDDSRRAASAEQELEAAWHKELYAFLRDRLIPLGGARIAIEAGGKAICFALTEAGQYLLGTRDDFELPGDSEAHIVIQPNFDVVFLAPSAGVEAELGRFCERTGKHVGTLFRITKSSILTAAAAGLTHDTILEILREHCQAGGIPSNVEAEIAGWGRRYRQVAVRCAVIIDCPDAETTTRVLGALGAKAGRLSETSLELYDEKFPAAVSKRLREAGIFVRF